MVRAAVDSVLDAGHSAAACVLLTALLGWPAAAPAQTRDVTGPYVALDVGRQHVIGGSLVDGVDTLQEDVRAVTTASAGLRAGVGPLVLGGELGRGWLDGALERRDPATATVVQYDTSSQWHWLLSAGARLDPSTVLYGYLSEVTRSFDVRVARGGETIAQQDEQGLLRFGLGLDRRLRGPLRLRVTAGTSRADFGGRPTNIEPRRRFEASAGLLWQF